MKLRHQLTIIIAAVLLFLTACGAQEAPAPKKISAAEAKEIMDSGREYFLLDVRTDEEFAEQHIEGAVCIPDTELSERQSELPESRDALILVYCRSGRRSAASSALLAEMGYRNVCDFGGIIDWGYETVSAEASPDTASADGHEHVWEDFDCNYRQCSICGLQRRYSDT